MVISKPASGKCLTVCLHVTLANDSNRTAQAGAARTLQTSLVCDSLFRYDFGISNGPRKISLARLESDDFGG
jgi:hypothetical protein